MKKYLYLVIPAITIIFFAGCQKDYFTNMPVVTTQTINATIDENGTYTYTLPAFDSGNVSIILNQASNASVSIISTDTSGVSTYKYIPANNYTGTDFVKINSTGYAYDTSTNSVPKNGNISSNAIQNTVITSINITIKGK